jgi:uncharacterized membrane protein (UPF0127 family)
VRTTLIAIIAAAAAGIIATAVIFYPTSDGYGYIGSLDWRDSEPETEQQELVVGGATTNGYRQVNITANGFELVADIAATRDQQSLGLGVKDTMAENEGMLFVFTKEKQHSFWMYGMKFPIDIIWLDGNRTVVHIEHSLEPCGATCETYTPAASSLYVLETVAGFAKEHDVKRGTQLEFELS